MPFRDLKGFNYRDYGVEFGPIKADEIKKYFCLYILQGVGWVSDRTLVAEEAIYLLILLKL
jgi:hypothetical protein